MLRIAVLGSLLLAGPAFAADEMVCPTIVNPVCALKSDGTRATMNNQCEALRGRAQVLHDGACEGGDMCAMLYKPVCGIVPATGEPHTYSNLCVAEHADAKIDHDGACSGQ
jgi:hypothetical protein